jgi:hypothetical protein
MRDHFRHFHPLKQMRRFALAQILLLHQRECPNLHQHFLRWQSTRSCHHYWYLIEIGHHWSVNQHYHLLQQQHLQLHQMSLQVRDEKVHHHRHRHHRHRFDPQLRHLQARNEPLNIQQQVSKSSFH